MLTGISSDKGACEGRLQDRDKEASRSPKPTMTNDETVLSPEEAARRWTYSDDGTHAYRALDNVTLTLHGQRDAEPRSSGKWLPTLLFTLSGDRFACELEIERQVYTIDIGAEQKPMPYVAWRVNYPAMKVVVDGNAQVPVSALDLTQWLDFDMLFLGVLEFWPRPDDESALPDHEGKHHRFIYLQGGWLGGEWADDFVRAAPFFCPNVENSQLDLRQASNAEIPKPPRNWHYVADEQPSIVNAKTGVRLTYDGLKITETAGRGKPYHYFELDMDEENFLFRVYVQSSPDYRFHWRVHLDACVLLTKGWSVSDFDNSDNIDKRIHEMERLAPDPLKLAQLVHMIGEALVHWPRLDAYTGNQPTTVTFLGLHKNTRFWPFVKLAIGRQAAMFNLFDSYGSHRRGTRA